MKTLLIRGSANYGMRIATLDDKDRLCGKSVTKHQDTNISEIADEIIRYLSAHQNAADSLEGVAQWWISRQRIQESTEQVKKALDLLCEKGLVNATPLVGRNMIYSLNKEAVSKLHRGC